MSKKLKIIGQIIISILILILLQVNIAIAEGNIPDFDDVKKTDWFYNDVMEARKIGLVEGVGNNKYVPHEEINYAQYLTITVRIVDPSIDSKPDVGQWYDKFILRARELGILAKNELINPTKAIPREDMVKFTCKSLGIEPYEGNEIIFNDVDPKDAQYLNAAYKEYLIEGTSILGKDKRRFGFGETATRAQLAAMALRIKSYKDNPTEYKKQAAIERQQKEAEVEKKKQEEAAKYTITEQDIQHRYVSVEKSRIFIEEVIKNVKVNPDMTVTITVPDILPKGWYWRMVINCYEKGGDAYPVFESSDIVIGKPVTTKLYTDAKNIKQYTICVEFDNGLPGNDPNNVDSGIYISKDLLTGTTRIYDKYKQELID